MSLVISKPKAGTAHNSSVINVNLDQTMGHPFILIYSYLWIRGELKVKIRKRAELNLRVREKPKLFCKVRAKA